MKSEHSEYYMQHYSNETENLLLKYWCQQAGFVIDNGGDIEEYAELIDWINDGKPTGIATNDEFYALQEVQYGKIIQLLYVKPHRVKYFYFAVNHYKRYDFDKKARRVRDTGKFNPKNIPYRCTPRFEVNGFCTLEHLESKDKRASFQKLTDGVYGLKATPEIMNGIVCNILPETERTAMLRTVNAFSGTPEIILVAVTTEIPEESKCSDSSYLVEYLEGLIDYSQFVTYLEYIIEYHEDPFYDKIVELGHLSSFYCNPDILPRAHERQHRIMTKANNIEKAYDFGASEFNREMKRIAQDRLKRGLPVSFDIPSDATLEDLEEIKAFEAWVMDGQPVED